MSQWETVGHQRPPFFFGAAFLTGVLAVFPAGFAAAFFSRLRCRGLLCRLRGLLGLRLRSLRDLSSALLGSRGRRGLLFFLLTQSRARKPRLTQGADLIHAGRRVFAHRNRLSCASNPGIAATLLVKFQHSQPFAAGFFANIGIKGPRASIALPWLRCRVAYGSGLATQPCVAGLCDGGALGWLEGRNHNPRISFEIAHFHGRFMLPGPPRAPTIPSAFGGTRKSAAFGRAPPRTALSSSHRRWP